MSEENNLSSNNLCITEDAFEKFQAGAMVEEEEFITLADIVSPQPEVPDLSTELNEIPYDNEVVLVDTNDDTSYSGSNIQSSYQPNGDSEKTDIINHIGASSIGDCAQGNSTKTQKRGRGRRKTKPVQSQNSNQTDSSQIETENESFLNNQDDVHSTTIDKNDTEPSNDAQGTKYSRRVRRERIPNTARYPLLTERFTVSTVKRRGRPKKTTQDSTVISEPDSTNTENSSVSPTRPVAKRGRRGRPKQSRIASEQVNPNDTSNISESDDNSVPLSSLKKTTRRGRKKANNTGLDKPINFCSEDLQIANIQNDQQLLETSDSQLENRLSINNPENPKTTTITTQNIAASDHEEADMDIDDGICLSKIKENINNITEKFDDDLEANMLRIHGENDGNECILNKDAELPVNADFEETLDRMANGNSIIKLNQTNKDKEEQVDSNDLLVEDTSKRPNRRKAKKNFKYDVDSDEDPFANVELSDDEPSSHKKKSRYNDDDEYIPGRRKGKSAATSSSDSEINDNIEETKPKRRKVFSQSPKKRGRKSKIDLEKSKSDLDTEEVIEPLNKSSDPWPVTDDIDEPLSMKPPAEAWATSNAFENFIAQKIQGSSLKIKKVSATQKSENVVAPLEIPVLKPEPPKKFVEMACQTSKPPTSSTAMQTSVPYDVPMKVNVPLTAKQSESACEFLNSVVNTTAELGELMKEKSKDFMKKKINTENVTDTFKMDYCVRKSFLLFKLAKHNLMQMEDDLAKQYEEFLRNNNLTKCRDQIKDITPTRKAETKADSDSDCEIVNVEQAPSTSSAIKQDKPKGIPKTVFLNKELSIKMAKKSDTEVPKNCPVWINKAVMVKKVKPTQSFLAQDSRNKKPPDYVTEKMVSDFFENYNRQRAMVVCAPFISTQWWSRTRRDYACHYFTKSSDFDEPSLSNGETIVQNELPINQSVSNDNHTNAIGILNTCKKNPKSLSLLCAEAVHNCLHTNHKEENQDVICDLADLRVKNEPMSLFRLCCQALSCEDATKTNRTSLVCDIEIKPVALPVPPLRTLCYRRIIQLMAKNQELETSHRNAIESLSMSDTLSNSDIDEHILKQDDSISLNDSVIHQSSSKEKGVQSLFSLCVISIQTAVKVAEKEPSNFENFNKLNVLSQKYMEVESPRSLKYIAYNNIRCIMHENDKTEEPTTISDVNSTTENSATLIENCINTIKSEVLFHNTDADNAFPDEEYYDYEPDAVEYEDDNDAGCEKDTEGNYVADNHNDGNEWISQVQMQVISSCIPPADRPEDNTGTMGTEDLIQSVVGSTENNYTNTDANENHIQSAHATIDSTSITTLDNLSIVPHIKQEPVDDIPENIVDSSIVKTEPVHGLDGMTIIPESIITKSELIDHNADFNDHAAVGDCTGMEASTSYNENTFNQFAKNNKMLQSADNEDEDSDEDLFSKRGVERSEHVPDYDAGNDMIESLLVPHTFEPLNVDNAKGVLMESSSDEGNDSSAKSGKKKTEKRRGRPKKLPKDVPKINAAKEAPISTKEALLPVKDKASTSEVAMLTRRMREKIRQEEKKIESSDSENDDVALSLRKDKNKSKQPEYKKTNKSSKQGESCTSKVIDNEIQCNNVDSTDQSLENKEKDQNIVGQFSGFSAIDQNEISSYQKYMKYVYDTIVPDENDVSKEKNAETKLDKKVSNRPSSPLIPPEEPVELLECEPTMPELDDEYIMRTEKQPRKVSNKKESKEKEQSKDKDSKDVDPDELSHRNLSTFTELDGWHIYPVNSSDVKLYQNCHIPLEKLPESFVDTYLEYQDITEKDNIDKEVDKLANLNSLNRSVTLKEGKSKERQKIKSSNASEQNSANVSRSPSPALSDRLEELSPSEDEGANVEDEEPPPMPLRSSENNLAKNFLMDDIDSDNDGETKKKIKQEPNDGIEVGTDNQEPKKPGPKSKTKMGKPSKINNLPQSESLMLTADKMMNKELNLLHAPIVMTKDEPKEVSMKEPNSKDEVKPKKRSLRSLAAMKDRVKADDDSSSEEEKQWVSTKEKLLKRVGKKEDALADDAKRAKLVDDFIVRRGEGHERRSLGPRNRRSRKKILERMKQERVLSRELFGESSLDVAPGTKRGPVVGLFKGRRNIRKVLDKKSLQKSTVIANMEEFERKRRLNAKQTQLRELLGYEEGVSVLVINDEVCLEYDFEEQRPVVTVHQFFTKVMKAHQYEGVKFMWDACFESLACIESGSGGGGCILAHCMGLGKTLQVLALLHTVLTHPRANMHRVLVCCPLSTVLNWVDEIHKWIGPVTDQIKVFELSKLKKTYERAYQLEDWYNGGGIFIIGYELFRSLTTLDPQIDDVRPTIINKIRTALLDPGPDIIICDEGHLLKNDCSVLAVAMSRVVTKRRIVLTGTPMQNNLREYYCMVNFVKPNLLGTYSEYSNRFENPIMNGQHRDSREEDIKLMKARTHILHKVLEGCLQRQEASVLYPYLPKKHEYTVFIPLTKCQWDLYKHYVHNYTKKSNKQSVLRDFHILQKIWSHPLVLHNFHVKKREVKSEKIEDDLALEDKEDIKPPEMDTWWLEYLANGEMLNSIDSSNKFVAVFRILDECIALGDKVLIFSTSLDCLDALECFLRQINGWNLGQEYYRLDGSVPAEVRQKWVREYNAENNLKTKLFLISTRAGCLGLNMTSANRVIILDTSWNPAHDIQSIFRVYRFGQKKDCYIYRLVAMGTMEQKIYERSVTKQAVACRVVDEQQIDRHYNMAELTELYKFDEHGVGVAGGVAVGVADVALLRVARDAAVHAVHEHDSLLRGSCEQELPETERAAAWSQFQQEHAHKQMQNDMETDKAARQLKKLQEKQQLQEQLQRQREETQRLELERQQAQVLNIKTEDGPVHDLLVPRAIQPYSLRGRGGARGRGRRKVVDCRIPIRSESAPAPIKPVSEEEMVQQISDILVQHNFTQAGKGPEQIKELVTKVKTMVQTGRVVDLGGNDQLTASIARVLMQKKAAPVMPALTDVQPPATPPRRGRPRKIQQVPRAEPPEPPPPQPPVELDTGVIVGGRLRRRAAIQAERQFELSDDGASQDSAPADPVIEVGDEDWHVAYSDTDSAPETETLPVRNKPSPNKNATPKSIVAVQSKEKNTKKSAAAAPVEYSSIVLSDEEPSPPRVKPEPSDKPTPLHPSLLTNQNFIKIVAHTYLAGNPMLDEDAATLAAQYSTLKLLKEFESTKKPIDSGPIYDIAARVLGDTVLKKLQQHPDSKDETSGTQTKNSGESSAVSSKMMQFLGETPPAKQEPKQTPTAAPAKKKIGPKSRVKKINEESQMKPTTSKLGIVPMDRLRGESEPRPAPTQTAGECILPDDEDDVRCITEPAPTPNKLPVITLPLIKLKLPQKETTPNTHSQSKAVIRVPSFGKGHAPSSAPNVPVSTPKPAAKPKSAPRKTYATISLDSDDEEPPIMLRKRGAAAAERGPVPVALTGPDSKTIPLTPPQPPAGQPHAPAPPPTQSTFYPYQSTIARPDPVPVALTGPGTGPVPISMIGPGTGPMPVSLAGPGNGPVSVSMSGSGAGPVPVSMTRPGAGPVPISITGPGFNSLPLPNMYGREPQTASGYVNQGPPVSYAPQQPTATSHLSTASSMPMFMSNANTAPLNTATTRPVTGALPPGVRTVRLTLAPGQTLDDLQHLQVPGSGLMLSTVPSAPLPPAAPQVTRTLCKPGDILRLNANGQLEVIKRVDDPNEVHTIDDDDESPPNPAPVISGKKAPKTYPAPKPTQEPKPSPASKTSAAPKQSTPAPVITRTKPEAEEKRRRKRMISSSSSDSSRSASPDPLSILKDVVHIQAPERKRNSNLADVNTTATKPATTQSNSDQTKQTLAQQNKEKEKIIAAKLNDILTTVKAKKSSVITINKSVAKTGKTTGTVKESIDLTDVTEQSATPTSSKTTSISKTTANRVTKSSNVVKRDIPSTVVGTSKSIVLDGKSKSLTNKDMVDLTGQKNIQVTKVKTLYPSEKRSAPAPDPPVVKKKKTEPMTLKDFDIDAIDDIIELD